MYHALLFLHVLSAFFLAAGVVMFSAFVLGSPVNRTTRLIGEILFGVGALGTLVFGIWLALNRPEYEIWDGWIIAAIALWAIATELGRRAQIGFTPASGGGDLVSDSPPAPRAVRWAEP